MKRFFLGLGVVTLTGLWIIQCDESTSPPAAPKAPVLVAPADMAADIVDSILLTWSASAGAASYHVQLSTDSAYSAPVINDSGLTATSRAAGALTEGTTYFWRVRAKGEGGVSAWSARRFTTAAAAKPALVITSPVDGQSFSLTDTIPVKWEINPDSLNTSNVHSYLKQFTLDSGKSWHDCTPKAGSEKQNVTKYSLTWIGLDTSSFKNDSAKFTKEDFLNRVVQLQVISYPPHSKTGFSGYITFHE